MPWRSRAQTCADLRIKWCPFFTKLIDSLIDSITRTNQRNSHCDSVVRTAPSALYEILCGKTTEKHTKQRNFCCRHAEAHPTRFPWPKFAHGCSWRPSPGLRAVLRAMSQTRTGRPHREPKRSLPRLAHGQQVSTCAQRRHLSRYLEHAKLRYAKSDGCTLGTWYLTCSDSCAQQWQANQTTRAFSAVGRAGTTR